uniref:G-protein coupled receptors family 1 profile domain-containing protein n=1 Tax=Cairina moschata TaxID=8855 RepID=A0A8C3BZZ4_CAIMO
MCIRDSNRGMYLLTAISIERCVSVVCSSSPCGHRPQHLSAVVCALLWALSIAVIAAVAVLCLSHQQDQCHLALISMYALNFTVFAPSMVFSSILLFIKVQCGSQQRQPRRLYIVIFLTVLFFLLFMVPLSIWNFMQHFSSVLGHSQVVFLLACINSSINPFIYFLVGGCRRRCSLVSLQVAFRRVFEELADDTVCSDNATMDTLSPEDPPEGHLEGHQGAAPLAAPHQEVDEGVDAAVDAGKQENNLGVPQHGTEMLHEIPDAEGDHEKEEEEDGEEDNDVEPPGLAPLGAALDLNEQDHIGNDHGRGKNKEVEGVHGDEGQMALVLLV